MMFMTKWGSWIMGRVGLRVSHRQQSTWWESHERGQKNRLARRNWGLLACLRNFYLIEPVMGQRTILRRVDIVKVKNQKRFVTQFKRCLRSEKQHGNMSQWPKKEMCMLNIYVVALERWADQIHNMGYNLGSCNNLLRSWIKYLYLTQTVPGTQLKLNKGYFTNMGTECIKNVLFQVWY